MRRWLKGLAGALFTAVLVLVLATGIVTAYGAIALPREHVASATVHIEAPPARVFEVLADIEHAADWRPNVERVEMLGEVDGRPRWREHGKDGAMIFERLESEPPRRMVVRVTGEEADVGGRWTFELERTTRGTALTITERGWIDNPLFRALAHHVFGLDTELRAYGQAVATRIEEQSAGR